MLFLLAYPKIKYTFIGGKILIAGNKNSLHRL